MLAGGLGAIDRVQVEEARPAPGDAVIVLGGPAMLIGLGGGAASSVASGDSAEDLDFASVQRDNPEMERRCQEVIDRCVALGEDNPIRQRHDVGAGGLSNAIPELLHDSGVGGVIDLAKVPSDDPSLSPMQLWCNESQERYVLGVPRRSRRRVRRACASASAARSRWSVMRRPKSGWSSATAPTRRATRREAGRDWPIDLPMDVLFGKPPKMHRDTAPPARRAVAGAATGTAWTCATPRCACSRIRPSRPRSSWSPSAIAPSAA